MEELRQKYKRLDVSTNDARLSSGLPPGCRGKFTGSPPKCGYQAALIAFREEDYAPACTYLRKGIAANVYIAEGLTGRTVLTEHSVLST